MNLLATKDFPPLNTEKSFFLTVTSMIYCKINCLYLPIFYLVYVWIYLTLFWKALVIVITFLSFKGITHIYWLKRLITRNKKQILLLNLLINCILARSVPQMSLNNDCTFLLSNFLMIGLCSSSAIHLTYFYF